MILGKKSGSFGEAALGVRKWGGIPGMEGPVPALSILDRDGCSWCSVVLCAVKMV